MTQEAGITKRIIYRTLAVLSVITIVEIAVALLFGDYLAEHHKTVLVLFYVTLSLAKAFYIVSEFMHMKYETKGFVFATLGGLILLIWFIISMMHEGNAWLKMRDGLIFF